MMPVPPVGGINIALVQEYVPLPDKGQVIGNVLSETAKGIEGAFIEFYPLDPDDEKMLSDHPVVRAWTDSSEAFKADLPNGDWGLMVNHPDRTKESGWVTITVMGDVENAGNIVLKNRPVATLTGSLRALMAKQFLLDLNWSRKRTKKLSNHQPSLIFSKILPLGNSQATLQLQFQLENISSKLYHLIFTKVVSILPRALFWRFRKPLLSPYRLEA